MKKYLTIWILILTNWFSIAATKSNTISTNQSYDEAKLLLIVVFFVIVWLIAFIIKSNIDYKWKNKDLKNSNNHKKKKRRKN